MADIYMADAYQRYDKAVQMAGDAYIVNYMLPV